MLKLVTIDKTDPWGISLDDIKKHLYETSDDNDDLIVIISAAAREYAEGMIWKQIIPASYVLYLDEFPESLIELPRPPVIAVATVKYYDGNNTLQTFSSSKYQVDLYSDPCRIQPVSGEEWPEIYDKMNAVEIAFTAGYNDSDDRHRLPHVIKQAQLMLIKHYYDHRDTIIISEGRIIDVKEVPLSTNMLLDLESARSYV